MFHTHVCNSLTKKRTLVMMCLAQNWVRSICRDKISASYKPENRKHLNGQLNQESNESQKKLNLTLIITNMIM